MNPNYYIASISSYLCSTILAPNARVSPYDDVQQALQSPLTPYEFSIIRSPFQQCCRLYRLLLNGPLTFREAIAIKIKNPNRPEGRRERLRARNINQVCICVLFKSEKKKKRERPSEPSFILSAVKSIDTKQQNCASSGGQERTDICVRPFLSGQALAYKNTCK